MFMKQTWEFIVTETPRASVHRQTSSRGCTNYCWPSPRYVHAHKSFSREIWIVATYHADSIFFACLCLFCQELEMLKEVTEASVSMNDEVNQLQTWPLYRSRGQKHTFRKRIFPLIFFRRSTYRCMLCLNSEAAAFGECPQSAKAVSFVNWKSQNQALLNESHEITSCAHKIISWWHNFHVNT